MNKQQLIEQLWADPIQREFAGVLGYETTSQVSKLKVDAIRAMMAECDEDSQSTVTHNVVPAKYRAKYTVGTSASGKSTLNCGDKLAALMAGMPADQVCRIADAAFGLTFGHHAAKYAHLNTGMQRMNAGNRVRGLIARRGK